MYSRQAVHAVPFADPAFGAELDQVCQKLDVGAVARAQEGYLAELAAAELARRREQIATYITQARFAVAQIYDQAVRATEKTP